MHTPHPPRPTYPPAPGPVPGESDETLAARLRGWPEGGTGDPVALLMARHWQPTYDYAVICLATQSGVASMVTATAFHRVLDGLMRGESGVALRPRLLVAARDTVKEWSAEGGVSHVLSDLRKPAGGRGMRAAKSMTPENRKLIERSFRALPAVAQCLLWHTEVEAEMITIPTGLLGLDADSAVATLEQARDKFREGCVRAHRELAPSKDCRFYNRLLDVPIRRGGALLPDVQQHLLECRYCRYAAEQLSHFEGGLGGVIAEAVLGWGARRYLDSRPGRMPDKGHSRRPGSGGRHRLLSQIPAQRRRIISGARNPRALITVGVSSGALIAAILGAAFLSDDGGGADPAASTSATGGVATAPDTGNDTTTDTSSATPPAMSGRSAAPQQTRLRNQAADLCLDIHGGKAEKGASTELAVCDSGWTQKWSYEADGLLRSVANPELCLDSQVDAGLVVLGRCADEDSKRGDDVRYDFTVQGELLPRWGEGLAVAPVARDADADIVVKVRDNSSQQRWLTDGVTASPESLSVSGSEASTPETEPVSRKPEADDASPAPGREKSGSPEPSVSPEAEQGGSILSVGDDTTTDTDADSGTGSGSAPVLPLTSLDLPNLLTGLGL
ncbi:RICIN domain-containing protein [Streptomyces europaeiscabiei]|uniref:RICIN domain-containing protein n=2 Tax=Streptomyces europaeiscabiei TaxID=146819 RepID=UPI000765D45B|nr:RICIN domain-containing protein [Streptomyces europaeiscabiei]MDX2527471.1 RICIN domain-containing protein [Streptomyces europaeiscabiei]MDX3710862.1 RICIN domain-containing protein [Streptomyces europaeiscabiei]MDX3835141.1 RICIN domain-containing protein [Streptomyces europaeiscabiei]MDX3863011.1 RICIN domain-containing protein [Streptomyces europaeiscabiei]MDX3871897.1 RICIN domain-containing protein [Streptomyces europaeiscabiei]